MKSTEQSSRGKKKNPIIEKVRQSAVIRALMKFVTVIYNAVFASVFAKIFSSHDNIDDKFNSSASASLWRGGAKRRERKKNIKNRFAAKAEQSAILNLLQKINSFLLRLSLQSCGSFLFAFGFSVVLIYATKRFALASYAADVFDLAAGLSVIPFAVILFFSKKSLADAITSSVILKAVLKDFLGVRSENTESTAKRQAIIHVGVPFLIGGAIGAASFFIDPVLIIGGLALAVAFFVVFSSPETGIIAVFTLLPFLKTMHIAAVLILIAVSYALKFICGRRTFKFAVTDFFVLLFAVMTLSGGIISVDRASSIKSSLLYVCFIGGYFLVKQMIGSSKMINRALVAVSVSCAVVSVIGIVEYFIGSPSAIWQDNTLFSDIRGRVVSTFENPNVLGEYLILSVPVSVAMAVVSESLRKRFAHALSAFLGVFCLVLTWSRGAWLGFLAASGVTLLIASRKWLVAAILSVPALGAVFSYAGGTFVSRLSSVTNLSDSSTAYRLNIWKSTLKMLGDTFYYGIGTGTGAFEQVFPFYAISGLSSVYHSHNLYLQITVETGIFSLAVFLAVIFLSGQKTISFAKDAQSKKNRSIALALFCALLAFLIQGLTDYVFYNYRITLLFWMLLGLSLSHVSASKDSSEEIRLSY